MSSELGKEITVRKAWVRQWQEEAREALDPKVPFNLDQTKMFEAAYNKRRDALLYLLGRFNELLEQNDNP